MAITAGMVKELREMTGAGMMDCKKALAETNGDMDAAVEFLRKNGQAKAEKKAGRIAAEGIVKTVVKDDKVAAIVEVNSETDFVAKNDEFQGFVEAVANQVVDSEAADLDAFMAEAWEADTTKTVKDALVEKIAVIGENLNIRRFEKGSRGERYLDGIRVRIGRTYELFPDFIGKFYHIADDWLGQCRIDFQEQALFHCGIRVIDPAHHETVKPREIHPAGSLIKSRVVPTSVGIARAGDTEHFMRMNDFPTVLRQTQGRTFQNTVKTDSNLWREQIHFVYQEKSPVTHRQGQRPVLVTHASLVQGNMTTQVSELHPSVTSHLENGIVQPSGKLLDKTRLSRTRRAVEVQRIKFVHEPDGGIPCRFVKAVVRIKGRGIQTRILISPNLVSGRHATEDKPGIHFCWREDFQFHYVL